MPRATVNTEAIRYDLKTCPDGFVMLRALPYGKMLERREKASRMTMDQEVRRGRGSSQRIDFSMMQRWTRQFEFENCIVDHNLENDTGQKLNFSMAGTLEIMDPKIGAEIEKLIDELNQDEEVEDLDDFPLPSTPSSESETTSPASSDLN